MFNIPKSAFNFLRNRRSTSAEIGVQLPPKNPAGERIGYDRWLKANTVKRRTHSLFRQGLMLYHHLPNWPEDRVRPLMETFGNMLLEQRVYREVFGVI